MAKSIKTNTEHRVYGYDLQDSVVKRAQLVEAIDGVLDDEKLAQCKIVLIALYPDQIEACLKEYADKFPVGSIVVDCGGIKRDICRLGQSLAANRGWTFCGGHPMAGIEKSGFAAARQSLFAKATMILVTHPDVKILVNSAGMYQEKRIENVSVADYNRIMDVNVKGTLLMIQACQPCMLPHGETETGVAGSAAEETAVADSAGSGRAQDCCIINIASDAGIGGNYGCPVYCASKGAVVSLSKALALDFAPDIRVNCICPGDVDTPLLTAQLEAAKGGYTKEEMGEGYPLGRIATVEEVAHVICSVASPANSFMTGAVIPIDGGLTAMG